ncbi:dicarboxylate/amino acid:cation symporter [Aureibacter tunicatorum]|uniref:Na+/H+-dicarboxylate symporter n=1 Tax=Aureibacter tunicatorum TaxID=866807 RepID=A0AAE3XMM2_9BACT|nr:cation:dicarboxylase symporter family transporter [Aureibacter tunicatorum]MDR6239373.1 hypothetical protein [Aureibacter tunicatorum]BDD04704.1 putative symporter [Aureibacter tunicatorum]
MEVALGLVFMILAVVAIRWTGKKFQKSIVKNLTAVVLGVIFGVLIFYLMKDGVYDEFKYYLKSVSNVYIRSLKMMIVPIVFISVTTTIVSLDHRKSLGKKFSQVISFFVVSIVGASLLSYLLAMNFNFSDLVDIKTIQESSVSEHYAQRIDNIGTASFGKVVLGLTHNVPTSIFDAFSNNNVIGTLIVAILLGVSIRKLKTVDHKLDKVDGILDHVKNIVSQMTKFILALTPYGIFVLMTIAVAEKGPFIFGDFAKFIGVSYLGMLLIIVMHLIVNLWKGVNPKRYFMNVLPAMLTGFTTQSSGATLPVTISSLEKRNGVDSETANITGSLGTTMGMNACGAMWPTFMIVIGAGLTNALSGQLVFDLASVSTVMTIVLAVVISSFGIVGLPGTASFAAITAMTIMGFDAEVIGLVLTFVLSVDTLIDMGRTATNIFGVTSAATFISKHNKEWSHEVFQQEN